MHSKGGPAMEKFVFEEPTVDVILFNNEDVITASNDPTEMEEIPDK